MQRIFWIVVGIAALSFISCLALRPPARDDGRLSSEVRSLLEGADRIELLSLSPDRPAVPMIARDGTTIVPPPQPSREKFHEWPVLGKTWFTSRLGCKTVVSAIEKGVADSDGSVAACFNPRHGVRAFCRDRTIDLVICFECGQIAVYVDGVEMPGLVTANAPQRTLDNLLLDAGVPLARKP